MFGLFKRNAPAPPMPPRTGIRDTLFGDMPLAEWPSPGSPSADEPWMTFVKARQALGEDRVQEASAGWKRITQMPGLESRHYAQAWHFLRAHGEQPPQNLAKQLLGVVVEVPMERGLDLLAAYPEHTARYYNQSGGGVVWEHPDTSIDGLIDALLAGGQRVLNAIGPLEDSRPSPPPPGKVRLNMISPAGLHFGQGAFSQFAQDPLAKPLVDAAIALMQRLVDIGLNQKPPA